MKDGMMEMGSIFVVYIQPTIPTYTSGSFRSKKVVKKWCIQSKKKYFSCSWSYGQPLGKVGWPSKAIKHENEILTRLGP